MEEYYNDDYSYSNRDYNDTELSVVESTNFDELSEWQMIDMDSNVHINHTYCSKGDIIWEYLRKVTL